MHLVNLRSIKEKVGIKYVGYGIGALVGYKLINYMIWKTKNKKLNIRSAQIVAERDSKTYTFIEVSPEKTQLILNLPDIQAIRENLFQRSFTISELVTVYSKRTVEIGRQLNLTAVELIDQALITANEYDQILDKHLKDGQQSQLPPLFGIPISTKGDRNSRGAQIYQDHIADDAVTVKLFKKAGAIIIVKARSSGGDSALVASRCVVLAVGTDIGGSIRVPAAFNGLFSFKPTGARTSNLGYLSGMPKISTSSIVLASQGPMARSNDDLVLATKLQLDPQIHTYDWKIPSSPFRENEYISAVNGGKQKLRVGYIDRLPTLQSSKGARRALQIAKDALEKQGFELVPFNQTLEEVQTIKSAFQGIMISSNAGPVLKLLSDQCEDLLKVNVAFYSYYSANPLKKFLLRTLLKLTGNHRFSNAIANCKDFSKDEIDDFIRKREESNENIRAKFQDLDIIGLILPNYVHCAFKESNQLSMNSLIDYTSIWNFFMYPCGTVPTTLVQASDTNPNDYQDSFDDKVTKSIRNDIEDSEGMPMGVQVVGLSQMDERVLGLMKAIDNGVQFRSRPKDF
ncbi:amidase family protein [Stylonychia lemnae]|uniref:Amidase family protein n=1 Tax=Stylonychia lemnae TaxID=5949 RepID=A0A078AV03_STYLE|nr:amidase family protein [Stylonychia lemnae]|eukprot:CDW85826.1 amidase family protein [Stylonychia lemnae]